MTKYSNLNDSNLFFGWFYKFYNVRIIITVTTTGATTIMKTMVRIISMMTNSNYDMRDGN